MKTPKVLIADDDPYIRKLLQVFLRSKNYEVLTADDGAAAIRITQEQHPFAVLLDINMPGGMNGIDAMRKIRAVDAEAVIIMASGIADEEVVKAAVEEGSAAYVLKPFDLDYLERLLSTYALFKNAA